MNLLEAEGKREAPMMLDTPYFTAADFLHLCDVFQRDGVDLDTVRFTFGQRHDLSGVPWQLYGMGDRDDDGQDAGALAIEEAPPAGHD